MKRNPVEASVNEKLRSIKVKTIKPLIFWTRCCKCGNEFKREPMYQCSYEDYCLDHTHYYSGCTHCFKSGDDLVSYLQDNHILYTAEELYDSDLWFTNHISNRIKEAGKTMCENMTSGGEQ